MFRFENPIFLWLFIILPLLCLVEYLAVVRTRRRLKNIGDTQLVSAIVEGSSALRRRVKFILMLVAISIVIIVMAQPQLGMKSVSSKRAAIEAIIALDISNSMMAQDVSPSRLDKSKLIIGNLVDKLNDDKLGLIVFAGDAFVQLPITSDYVSAKMFIQNLSPAMIAQQGTDIAAAIRLATASFTQKDNIGRTIILITDGEDHEGGAEQAASEAHKKDIVVHVLGVGSDGGAPIPTSDGNYITDENGETVVSRLNQPMCNQVAQAGGGIFINVDNTSDAQTRLLQEVDKMQRGQIETVTYSQADEQFQAFAIILLIVLVIEFSISRRSNPKLDNLKLFRD